MSWHSRRDDLRSDLAPVLRLLADLDNRLVLALQGSAQVRSLAFSAAAARRALDGMQSLRWAESSPGFSSVRATYAGRTGVCGNGLCEVLNPLSCRSTSLLTRQIKALMCGKPAR